MSDVKLMIFLDKIASVECALCGSAQKSAADQQQIFAGIPLQTVIANF
jgi:hypothetical protein